MQELKSFTIKSTCNNRTLRVNELDMDDSIIYEVLENNDYLFTLSKDGKIIFNNLKNSDLDDCLGSIINEIVKKI
jgi:hypothetical protein